MILLFTIAQACVFCVCAQAKSSSGYNVQIQDCIFSNNQINLEPIPMTPLSIAAASFSTVFPGAGGAIFFNASIELTLIDTTIADSIAL